MSVYAFCVFFVLFCFFICCAFSSPPGDDVHNMNVYTRVHNMNTTGARLEIKTVKNDYAHVRRAVIFYVFRSSTACKQRNARAGGQTRKPNTGGFKNRVGRVYSRTRIYYVRHDRYTNVFESENQRTPHVVLLS